MLPLVLVALVSLAADAEDGPFPVPHLKDEASLKAPAFREWIDHTGMHKTRARLKAIERGSATLELESEKRTIRVPIERLSEEDVEYMRKA